MMTGDKLLKHAKYYGKMGLPVFPCWPQEKHPATTHGCKEATTDQEQITKWWTGPYLYNVALATGGGLVVLDVDVDHDAGKYGDETLEALESKYGPLPDTWTCLTGGGGIHYYFQCDDPNLTVAAGFAPGLDYRGAGGYVMVPPSVHENGREYVWEVGHTPTNTPLAPLPEWLHTLMLNGAKPTPTPRKEAPEKVAEGQRNQEMFKLAASLRSKGLTVDEITAAVTEANKGRCNPPLPDSEIKAICNSAGRYERGPEQSKEVRPLSITPATVLQTAKLPPVKFLIEGVLPDGTSLLTAASKIGKSWMVLDLGLSQAAGGEFMGHQCNQCGVLYMALEDSLHRLQNRMNKILNGKPAPEQFYFATEAPKLDKGLLDTLDDHLKKHPDTKLIIIDTLQKIRGQALPREASYAQDYREMETVKAFLDKRGVSAIFVHHNRKMKDDDDPFNMISGTNGIMGAADTIWTITKTKRTDDEATLHITGRDVEQSDTVIRFDKTAWKWKPVGEAGWLAEQRAREEYDSNPTVKTIKKLLEQSPDHRWSGTAKGMMDAGRFIARTYLASSEKKLGKDIAALEKPLFEFDKIIHSAGSNGTGGKKHSFWYQDLGQFEELPEQQEMPWTDIPQK